MQETCLVQAEIALGGLGSECHAGNAVNAASLEGHLFRETFLENYYIHVAIDGKLL